MILKEASSYIVLFSKMDIIVFNFLHNFNKSFFFRKYKFLINCVRSRIRYSKSPNDLVVTLKFICYWFNCKSNDDISNILTSCFTIYPLNDYEIEKLSKWEQYYQRETGINSFTTTLFWICYIQVIMEQI